MMGICSAGTSVTTVAQEKMNERIAIGGFRQFRQQIIRNTGRCPTVATPFVAYCSSQ